MVMAQENLKPSLVIALRKIIKCLRTVTQQSLNYSLFEALFGRSPNTIWHNLVKLPSSRNLDWNKTLLCIDKGQKIMCQDIRHDCDAPDEIEDRHLDKESSSSDDTSDATRYVPTSSGSPVKVLSRAEKRKTLGVKNPYLSNSSGKKLIYRKVQDRKKDKPYCKELKEEIIRESDHKITLKNGKVIRKIDLAVKKPSAPKKNSPQPQEKNQLIRFHAKKRPRKVMKSSTKLDSRALSQHKRRKNYWQNLKNWISLGEMRQ